MAGNRVADYPVYCNKPQSHQFRQARPDVVIAQAAWRELVHHFVRGLRAVLLQYIENLLPEPRELRDNSVISGPGDCAPGWL